MTCWETVGLLGPCALLASTDVRMVSIMLLTTEEVLQQNGYWYCLDTTWITVEMEPFEEVKPEHLFSKPLSRDVYYTKYPDIPRSESEDENPITVTGFRSKHEEWKSKIRIRKLESRKRYSSQSNYSVKSSNSNPSLLCNNTTTRVTSLVQKPIEQSVSINNDSKVRAFFQRLLQSVPPPPVEDLTESKRCSILETPEQDKDFNNIDVPDYAEFEKDKILNLHHEKSLVPHTSTLKRKQRKVTFNTDSSKCSSWYESIYGVSDIIGSKESLLRTSRSSLVVPEIKPTEVDTESPKSNGSLSWADLLKSCGVGDSILNSTESLHKDDIVSQSHCANDKVFDISSEDDETEYAKFAVHKICQTLKIQRGIIDSSSMNDLNNVEQLKSHITKLDPTFYSVLYRLTPKDIDDSPPENELQKNSDRVLSEHELRVQRSLQKLNVPEWYKNAPAAREGFLLRKRLSDASSAARWGGLNSKTTSLGSLGAGAQPPPPQLSPHTTSFGRWSTSRLNSNQTSPCSSTRSSVRGGSPLCSPSARSSFSARQPYLGWRSQERLNTTPRTPHERLASSLLQQSSASAKASEEIQSSIKEVTSAIVHYVSGLEPANGDLDRQPSPRSSQKLYWLESSFVEQPDLAWFPLRSTLIHFNLEVINQLEISRRLASSLLQQSSASAKASEEIQSSIKEVTSAIVHYVSGLEPANGDLDRQPSPRSSQKLYWLESSFVGTKPLESPQTPLVVTEALPPPHPRPPSSLRLEHRAAPDWQDCQQPLNFGLSRPSPSSTTLEDVLDSLLGLPSQPARIPTPQPSPRKSPYYFMGGKSPRYEQLTSSGHSSASAASRLVSTPSEPSSLTDPSPDRQGKEAVDNSAAMQDSRRSRSAQGDRSRRKSEPCTGAGASLDRRTSLDAATLRATEPRGPQHDSRASLLSLQTENSADEAFVKCKYPKCPSRAPLADAKRHYKSCHNCTTMYCSKECRRAHWEKHRKVCLHSRASALCRQIISAAKEDASSLHQISTIAHKGYLAHGRGVVKVFFTSPEAAEKFTTHGYQYLSEPEYVKWISLQPNEMGVELYTEVVKLCKSYNPETRVILFVAVCIISEVPTKGAVKWERQMVSRCAKLRLSKTVTAAIQEQNRRRHRRDSKGTPEDRETLILTSKLTNAGEKNAATAHKFREICFKNIVYELESRGVVLKKHFPEVYSRLAAYVDGTSDRFIPMTIYPRDVTSGKSFVCVIMPDSEADSGTPVDGKVLTVDVGLDRSRHQISTPM
ncbi:Uncharacterized protein C9orf172 [Papilio machaon]|uniref:Uncharacterized protein C9orf172 n=1 Tax=Papilio machaon TaxID=76193 RepID=A0A194QSX4_PAPMA|nr:Uncharacterized protein C9orf172 [Papilio machaon]